MPWPKLWVAVFRFNQKSQPAVVRHEGLRQSGKSKTAPLEKTGSESLADALKA
jgi:hypothetical protein